MIEAGEYKDDTMYYFCPNCDWRGTDSDAVLKMSGVLCPVCNSGVLIDSELMDEIDGAVA